MNANRSRTRDLLHYLFLPILGFCIFLVTTVVAIPRTPHRIGLVLSIGGTGIFIGLIVLAQFLANRRFEKRLESETDVLRESKILPMKGAENGADVIRLVNEGKLEEAALCYRSIYGGEIEAARSAVGIDPGGAAPLFALCFLSPLLLFVSCHSIMEKGLRANNILSTIFLLVVVAAAIHHLRFRKRVLRNRESIAAGRLPEISKNKDA
jgi:hypothetical protein